MIDYAKIQSITEITNVIQGEGKYMGVPQVLIRMSGCKLRCQFENSFCDSWMNSWQPGKGSLSLDDVILHYKKNKHIQCTMITGGSPTSNSGLLKTLCDISKSFDHFITIETEGSAGVFTKADFISLSPKLSNSSPRIGTWIPHLNRKVSKSDKEQHERHRLNYDAMELLISCHPDYQLKPVICSQDDLKELQFIQKMLDIPNNKIWLMLEGTTKKQLAKNRIWLMELCIKEGYNFSDRLHIIVYDNKQYV